MDVIKDSTDISTYFTLRDSTNHAPKTDVTITDIDLYYVAYRAAISSKADATALAAADSAHSDNKAYHVGQGLYRIDWPDIWGGAVGTQVQLIVVCTGVDTTFLEVDIVDPATYPIVNGDHGLVSIQDDIDTILTRIVGTLLAGSHTAQTGDSYAIINGDHGLVSIQDDVDEVLTRIPDATAGAAGGLPTVAAGGLKLQQTVDLTAGQSIACSDKTGFSLSATGADLILKSSTFVQAIVAAISELATYGLQALNTLLVSTGIKAATVPNVTLANGAHGGAGTTITLQTPVQSDVRKVNNVTLTGNGSTTPWGPA